MLDIRNSQVLHVPKIGQKADLSHPMLKGCVRWYPLNHSAGNIAFDLTNNDDGIYSGTSSFYWALAEELGVSANFINASNYMITTNKAPIIGTGPITVSCWFKTTSNDIGSHKNKLLAWGTDGTGEPKGKVFELGIENGVFWSRNYNANANGGSGFNDGKWHFLLVNKPQGATISGLSAFIDNTRLSLTIGGIATSSIIDLVDNNPLRIGAGWGNTIFPFNGQIQNLRIWNRDINDGEIQALYKDPWIGLEEPSEISYFLPITETPTTTNKIFTVRKKLSIYGNGKLTLRV